MNPTLIYIHWLDAAYCHEPDDPQTHGAIRLHTVGWLVREDDECVVIAMERYTEEGGYRDLRAIPHACVIDRREQQFELDA